MRVISGTAKGRSLKTLETLDTRPTADRVKEALFNIIYPYVYGSSVLDLFAGSGALGIEALSRGAKNCVFVEQSKPAASVIHHNLAHTRLSEMGEIRITDVLSYLKSSKQTFDLIMMDPPYHHDMIPPAIKAIDQYTLLKPNGIIVAECDHTETLPEIIGSFTLSDKRKYGRVLLHFYKT